jgi:AcrR family transcriptional regulator
MKHGPGTRDRIVSAAAELFYGDGIRAVSMDAVAERAGLTKRTLYYHFSSKDDLVAAYLDERDQPNLDRFRRWFQTGGPALEDGIRAVFGKLAKAAANRRWNGCGFLRSSAELANMPGHPAVQVVRRHKKRVEEWLAEECGAGGCHAPRTVARRLMILMDGGFATVLTHRDPTYLKDAGEAAVVMIREGRRPAYCEGDGCQLAHPE